MVKGILGKKIGMMQIFKQNGDAIPVTVIEAGPCLVIQLKTLENDGYRAIQLGFKEKRFIREFKISGEDKFKVNQEIKVDVFNEGDFVDITSVSIGKGFQGGMKKWGWSGQCASHGSMTHRRPGSIGASAFPSRVVKGHHLPGRMGGQRKTIQNLKVVKVDLESNILMIKGSVSGHRNSYLMIRNAKKKQQTVKTDKSDKQ
ncbi:MAG: 50S ribosomal protein L3 [Candidatus Omnitrophota bacterium]|nr:50S ribosomal protein L3 [Candidatus Omnitrophota bacterium]